MFCRFGNRADHLMKDPRKLDCGFSACLACIQEDLRLNANGRICCICGEIHVIADANRLDTDKKPVVNIEERIQYLMDDFLSRLRASFDSLQG
jgi:hypothetical protein